MGWDRAFDRRQTPAALSLVTRKEENAVLSIQIEKAAKLKPLPPDESQLGFGRIFTDYMALADWSRERGWHHGRIIPFGPLPLHPASTCLHYAAEVFEGLKAYRRPDGGVQLFRPRENARRMIASAERLCLPALPEEEFLHLVTRLIQKEEAWVPRAQGASLYIRPFILGTDETLGVHAAERALFGVILSPVGSYYREGLRPVGILIEEKDVRAVRGGTGYAKCGGNYAASIRAGTIAAEKGYSQVLWLDGVERRYVEEVGAMNVMFKLGDRIVTPALTDSILPGITRKSCIELLRSQGREVDERPLPVDELIDALEVGALEEAWGCGTAAVISPIGRLAYDQQEYEINGGRIGPVTQSLYDTLTGIQHGLLEDPFDWIVPVN